MKSLIYLFLIMFSMASSGENLIEKVNISRETLEKRKTIFIYKNKKFVGVREIDESHLVPSLPDFLVQLKKIVQNKELDMLLSMFSEDFFCINPGELKSYHKGIKECVKRMHMNRDSFWKTLESSVNAGGCIVDKKYFSLPSVLVCDPSNDLTFQLSSFKFLFTPLKVYKSQNASSSSSMLPPRHVFKEILRDEKMCLEEGLKGDCYNKWQKIESPLLGVGYVVPFYSGEIPYEYLIKIKYENGQFKIASISGAYPRR